MSVIANLVGVCSIIAVCCAQLSEVPKLFYLRNPTYLSPARYSRSIRLPESLPLGDMGSQDTMIIWKNGLVTFGALSSQADLTVPTRNYSMTNAEYLVAPFWFPKISRILGLTSTVSWDMEELTDNMEDDEQSGSGTDEGYLLRFAEDAVDNYTLKNFGALSNFKPVWAMVVNWNVHPALDYSELHYICVDFYECRCQSYYDYYYGYESDYSSGDFSGSASGYSGDDFSGSASGYSGSGDSCPTEECYSRHGWSDYDISYLDLTCRGYYVYVQFQLLLATDGIDTFALSLYGCNNYYIHETYDIVFHTVSVGYRLGNQHNNNTCINERIPELFECYSDIDECSGVISHNYYYYYYHYYYYYNVVNVLVWNLTNGFDEFLNVEPLTEGIDYIKFQYVNFVTSNHGYETNKNSSDVVFLQRWLDGASNAIIHPGIGIGTTIQTKIYVGTNGIVSFGRPFYFWYPQRFPTRYPWIYEAYVAAPFWMDIDIRSKGDVFYSTPSRKEYPHVFNTIDTFLSNQTNSTFSAEWILVATWLNVPVYPYYYVEKYYWYYSSSNRERILNDFNTFEAIIASSGGDSYAIFTYNCEELTNPGLYRGAVIGFNNGGFQYNNNPYSESQVAHHIACSNFPASNWFNLVYKLNSGEDEILRARKQCRQLVAEDEKLVSEKAILEYDRLLAPCPCTIWNAWRDRNYRWDSYNFYCYYRRLANPFTEQYDQYCCYDFNSETWGALVKSGHRVSGMARLQEDHWGRFLDERDQELKRYCCGLADLCDLYLKRRPPNDCTGYVPPVWTWAWGDPHLTTLDGHDYTFNGYGEFVMLRYSENVEFQARMRPTPGTQATQFSSFAIGTTGGGNRVEINCENPDPFCTTLYNGINISSNLTNVNDSYYSSADSIEVVRETETTVTVVLGLGMALAVTYNSSTMIPSFQLTLDPHLDGSLMVGLLGNRDGNINNDLIAQDGQPLAINATEQEIFNFGNTWLINSIDDSIFKYEDNQGPADYQNTSWTPLFFSDLKPGADVVQACTPEGASEPQPQCLFDATATGDISIGLATMDTLTENTVAMTESTNLPPVIASSSNETLYLSPSSSISITISITDDNENDDLPLLSLLNPPPGSSLVMVESGNYTFTWEFMGLNEDEMLHPLVFTANDSQGAATTYSPRVQVCACLNEGNCTLEGVTSTSDNLIIMNCICSQAWEGRYCQLDVDGCLEYACIEGVECVDVPAPGEGAVCEGCPVGYTADGVKCRDIDECADEGICGQMCTNTEGSYECSCVRGYITDPMDDRECIDYDECSNFVDDCDQICTNTNGSYICSCIDGFTNNGPSCDPNMHCESSAEECGTAHCADIVGAPYCYCNAGFSFNSESKSCEDTDECQVVNCSHMCTNYPGTFACTCNEGYQLGPDLISCIDINECAMASLRGVILCSDGEVCANREGNYECLCAPGTYRYGVVGPDNNRTSTCISRVMGGDLTQESVTVNLGSTTDKELFEDGKLDILSSVITVAVLQYCNDSDTICRVVQSAMTQREAKRKRDSTFDSSIHYVQPVFDIPGVSSGGSEGVSISFYVEVDSNKALESSDTIAAVESHQLLFQKEFGGNISFGLTYPPPKPTESPSPTSQLPTPTVTSTTDDKLSAGVIAGIAAAGTVAISIAAILSLLCIVQMKGKRNTKKEKCLWVKGTFEKGSDASEMHEVPKSTQQISKDHDPDTTVFTNEKTA